MYTSSPKIAQQGTEGIGLETVQTEPSGRPQTKCRGKVVFRLSKLARGCSATAHRKCETLTDILIERPKIKNNFVESIALKEYNMVRMLLWGVDTMQIKPSASIRQNYNEIADLCRSTGEPVFLTKNGVGDLVVMDIDTFVHREKMLKLREELLAVEEDRVAGRAGTTVA